MCFVAVPVNGQDTGDRATVQQKSPTNIQDPTKETPNVETANVLEQQDSTRVSDKDRNKPPSYFRRLIAPENLPNLILCIVGIIGIIAAVSTLRTIREQTII